MTNMMHPEIAPMPRAASENRASQVKDDVAEYFLRMRCSGIHPRDALSWPAIAAPLVKGNILQILTSTDISVGCSSLGCLTSHYIMFMFGYLFYTPHVLEEYVPDLPKIDIGWQLFTN